MKNIYPIVFSINNAYAPYLYVCIKSLLARIGVQDKYQFYVLQTRLSQRHQKLILSLQCDNLKIKFIDVGKFLSKDVKKTFRVTEHFTPETYYRFFLPQIFPDLDKILYLDADTLVMKNIATLFQIDIGNNYLGVTHDCEIVRLATIMENEYSDYFRKTLGVKIENYFQAGVMLVNLEKMRQDDITQKLLDNLKRVKTPKFVDQDILNMVCQNKIKFIPQNWDYTWHLPLSDSQYLEHLPDFVKKSYENARKNPYIIHFTGNKMKPIDYPSQPEAKVFWQYVEASPYKKYFKQQLKANIAHLSRQLHKKKIKLLKYKILDKITCGSLQKQFQHRQEKLQQQIREIQDKMGRYK